MKTEIIISLLTNHSVSILTITQMEYNGKTVELERTRKAYDNSVTGREALSSEVGEPYSTAILEVWGDTPTIQDPPQPAELTNSVVEE